jgi:hypothetical protein
VLILSAEHAATASNSEKPPTVSAPVAGEPEVIPGYTRSQLDTLDLAKIVASAKIFEDLYHLNDQQTVSAEGVEIRVEQFKLKDVRLEWMCEKIPGVIYVLHGNHKRALIQGNGFQTKLDYRMPPTSPATLLIENPTGGNCVNCMRDLVIDLEKDSFLQCAGQAYLEGNNRFYITEDVWETDLGGWFGHAGATYATIYLKVMNGRLVPDDAANAENCRNEIQRLDEEIRNMPRTTEVSGDLKLLHAALQRVLHYEILGKTQEGLDALKKDLDAHADEGGRLQVVSWLPARNDKTPVKEILDKVQASLAKIKPVAERLAEKPVAQCVYLSE